MSVLVTAAIFLVLPTIAMGLRLLARRISNRTCDISDWLMLSAWVLSTFFQIVCFVAVLHFGLGWHRSEIIAAHGLDATWGFSILLIPIQGLWLFSLSCSKLSVLLLYRKLFPVRSLEIAVWISTALIIVFLFSGVIGGLMICQPLSYQWDKTIEGGYCHDFIPLIKTTGAGNIITDIAALAISLPMIYKLQLPLQNKLVLLGAFGLGVVAVTISIGRLTSLALVNFDDITFTCVKSLIFTAVEPSLAIIVATVPLLRPLLGRNKYSENGTAVFDTERNLKSSYPQSPRAPKDSAGSFLPLSDSSQYQLQPFEFMFEGTAASISGSGDIASRPPTRAQSTTARLKGPSGQDWDDLLQYARPRTRARSTSRPSRPPLSMSRPPTRARSNSRPPSTAQSKDRPHSRSRSIRSFKHMSTATHQDQDADDASMSPQRHSLGLSYRVSSTRTFEDKHNALYPPTRTASTRQLNIIIRRDIVVTEEHSETHSEKGY